MQYRQFLKRVQDFSGFSDSEALEATRVFLETLGARLTYGEFKNFCAQLPQEIAVLAVPSTAKLEKLHGTEFLERIAERQHITTPHAKKQMYAVWETLKEAVDEGQMRHVKAQLPEDLVSLLH